MCKMLSEMSTEIKENGVENQQGLSIIESEKKLELETEQELPRPQNVIQIPSNTADIEFDPWALPNFVDDSPSWRDLKTKGKILRVFTGIVKICEIVLLLYFFVCSLDFLSTALRLIAGKNASEFLSNVELLQNPIVGLMSGVLATVVVQSSSTSTSILITMVGAKLINIKTSIPIIMGANIGTSVTNTCVSFTQATDRNRFRRAFAAATVHDWFNWMSVIVLLPIESLTGYLEHASYSIVNLINWEQNKELNVQFLTTITKPFTSLVVQIDKKVLEAVAVNSTAYANATLLKNCSEKCSYLMQYLGMNDRGTGLLLFFIALALLIACLVFIVKVLNSVLKGRIAVIIRKVINSEPRFPFNYLVGYLAILVGCGVTILVQSSSIFTSALTPLAGLGVISIDRMYPLTLGSNIGTTTTGILAAFAADPQRIKYTLQIAFCHLLFNLTGICLFYPLPFTRFPIPLAKHLGSVCAKYRWFSLVYLLLMFIFLPAIIFFLSLSGADVFMGVGITIVCILFLIIMINVVQRKRPTFLPVFLRNWNWLPLFLHSLDPLDRLITKLCNLCKCCKCCPQSSNLNDSQSLVVDLDQSRTNVLNSNHSSTGECLEFNGRENIAFSLDSKEENTKL